MPRRTYLVIGLLFSLALAISVPAVTGQDISSENARRLILNVYLDSTGKALVTGYVENPEGLPFLNSSQYSYENETSQLYALTNALTRKEGDIWTLIFSSTGYYQDYRVAFYLPSDFKVKNISSSQGLEHLLSASNDSLAIDFQGYDVLDPAASIEYQQPLETSVPQTPRPSYLFPLLLILIIVAAAALWWRSRDGRPEKTVASPRDIEKSASIPERSRFREADESLPSEVTKKGDEATSEAEVASSSAPAEESDVFTETLATSLQTIDAQEQAMLHEEAEIFPESEEPEEEEKGMKGAEVPSPSSPSEKILISSEMAAVMKTLTPRERAVLQALIDRGGRSTQADLRYETRTPKSSLTGIIYSLERRKLVTKKEWGRTNVIELSEWFLSKKEQS